MYSTAAEEQDNKVVKRLQEDTFEILMFVSPRVGIHDVLCINWNAIDWSILRCGCCIPCCDRQGPEAKQSGYLCILSWEHLSGSRRTERHLLPCRSATPAHASGIFRLGELTLVLKLSYER